MDDLEQEIIRAGYNQTGQQINGNQTNIAGDINTSGGFANSGTINARTVIGRDQVVFVSNSPTKQIDPQVALARLATMPKDYIPKDASLPQGSRMPLEWKGNFVGRQDELTTLANTLLNRNSTVVVTGIGGIGKTYLASAFVHHYGQYFLGGVFWLSFAEPTEIPSEVAECATAIEGVQSGIDRLTLQEKIIHVLQVWQDSLPRLLVFDNCEEPGLLEDWRPPSGDCRVLITSQKSLWTDEQSSVTIEVGALPREQSVQLLKGFFSKKSSKESEEQLEVNLTEIATELGDLPLALHLAGSYLSNPARGLTSSDYLIQLRKADPLKHLSLQRSGSTPTRHEMSVARTFALSYDRMTSKLANAPGYLALALNLLGCAACLAPGEPIPRTLLRGGAKLEKDEDEEGFVIALENLLNLGLLQINLGVLEKEGTGDLRMHRLLCSFVANTLSAQLEQRQTEVEEYLLLLANQLNDDGDPRPLLQWQVHLRYVTNRNQGRMDERYAGLCNAFGSHLQIVGDYNGAKIYYERALAIREKTLGDKHPDTATSLNNLGGWLRAVGRRKEARPYYERALEIRKATLGEQHPDTARSFNHLGGSALDSGDYELARSHFEQALVISEALLGTLHSDTAAILNNLGVLSDTIGDYKEALSYYKQSLAIRQEILVPSRHPDTAASLNNVGGVLQAIGDYTGALPYYQEALSIRQEVLGQRHPDTATSLNNLGRLFEATGNYKKALSYYQDSLVIRENVLGEHPDTSTSLNNLGGLLKTTGDFKNAKERYEQALAIDEKVFGKQHPATARTLNNLGAIQQALGDYDHALSNFKQALEIRQSVFGEQHLETAASHNNIGGALKDQGDYVSAQYHYEKALTIRYSILSEQHPDTAQSLNNLGVLFQDTLDFDHARLYYERALAIRLAMLGEQHADTAQCLNNLGGLFQVMGKDNESRPYHERALIIRETLLGEQHPDTAASLNNLGLLFRIIGDYARAEKYYVRSLKSHIDIFGQKHPITAASLNNLGILAYYKKNDKEAQKYLEQALGIYENLLGRDHPSSQQTRESLDLVKTKLMQEKDVSARVQDTEPKS